MENELEEKLNKIFGFKHGATYRAPSEDREQEKLFIRITNVKTKVSGDKCRSKVEGGLVVYADQQKLPFDYFEKRIEMADASLKKDFFFYDITANAPNGGELVERSASFIYFYSGQYDPNKGTINEVTIQCGGDT